MKRALLNQLRLEQFDKLTLDEKGKIVKELRDTYNYSYRKLEELTGIPHSTLLDWVTGRQKRANEPGHLHISIGRLIEHFSVYKPSDAEKPQISILIRKLKELIK